MPGMQSIEGLASNLNISEIVDTIISYERVPVLYLEREKELKTQQVAAYKAVLAKFLALKTRISLLKRASSYDKASIDISDTTVLSASANGRITAGTYNLRVVSLARNHQVASQGFDDATTEILGTGTIKLAVGENSLTTINIESGSNSLVSVKDAINNANVGITASIVNDGTSSKPYRLLLTANKTGMKNDIDFQVSLSGGETLDFVNSSFDNPETISFSTESTSQVSLGTTASYSGSENKIYTFTIAGAGTQTVGTDTITIEWTDGTNSGSILVTQADTEVELIGDGADGLKLSFSVGDLVAGDTLQVNTFAPLLQKAADAQITVGADGSGGGSPIIINSETNEFEDIIPGLTLDVKRECDSGETVTIKTDIDSSAIKGMIDDFVAKYNDVMQFINNQFRYDTETTESGVLFSNYSLQVMQSSLRSSSTFVVSGLEDEINSLSSIGVRTGFNGELKTANSARLLDAIKSNLDNFIKLFTDSGVSSSPYIEFVSSSNNTVAGEDYEIDITQAATKGYHQGTAISDPSTSPITLDNTNNVIKLTVDGMVSNEIVLTERTYSSGDELANEIQTRLDSDSKIKNRGVIVKWVEFAGTGYLKITSGSYGSGSSIRMVTSIANSAYSILGLSGGVTHAGDDVEGTINGEKATGKGQILTGDEGNLTTEGLKLKITLSGNQLVSGAEGTITTARGLATRIDKTLENITKSIDGSIARQTSALNKQIEAIDKQIEDYNERLERRREDLYKQFLVMEDALAQYQAEGSYLTTQLESISNNWNQILSRKK